MKHYTPGDEARLIEAVEEQGGRYLPETCMSSEIDDLAIRGVPVQMSTGCEEDAMMLVAYDPSATVVVNEPVLEPDTDPDAPSGRTKQRTDDKDVGLYTEVEHASPGGSTAVLSAVRVCANDDLVGHWPRFIKLMKNNDPILGPRIA